MTENELIEGAWDNYRTTEYDDMYEYMDHDSYVESVRWLLAAQRRGCMKDVKQWIDSCDYGDTMYRLTSKAIFDYHTPKLLDLILNAPPEEA